MQAARLPQSRRYADPERATSSPTCGGRSCGPRSASSSAAQGAARLADRRRKLEDLLARLDQRTPEGNGRIRLEEDRLVVGKIPAEDVPPTVEDLERLVDERLPLLELPDLSLELDGAFEHAGKGEPRSKDLLINCHASVLAQVCNFGLNRMAGIADLTYSQLDEHIGSLLRGAVRPELILKH